MTIRPATIRNGDLGLGPQSGFRSLGRLAGTSTRHLGPASRLWRQELGGRYGQRPTFDSIALQLQDGYLLISACRPAEGSRNVRLFFDEQSLSGENRVFEEISRESTPASVRDGIEKIDQALRELDHGLPSSLVIGGDKTFLCQARRQLRVWLKQPRTCRRQAKTKRQERRLIVKEETAREIWLDHLRNRMPKTPKQLRQQRLEAIAAGDGASGTGDSGDISAE